MSELLHATLVELCDALRTRRVSPVELMQATLARVEATHGALNAVVARRPVEVLLEDARAAEARITRGEARPLEGIPLGIKDLEDAEGLITSHGSLPFREHMAERDSTQVSRLRAAGAIVLGKTNAPEFGYTAITKNLVYGVTKSPWNLERTPGGSSGGSAAALAGEVLPLVTASDGGGSVRIPASFVGAFGLKTSFGRIPRGPFELWDHGMTSVYGPLTKSVDDAALFLDQVVGHDERDPASLPHPGLSYAEVVRKPFPSGLRVGFSPDLGYAIVQSDVAALVEDAARTFEKLGCKFGLVRGGPPNLGADWGLLGAFEIGARLAPILPEREGDLMKSLMDGVRFARGMTQAWWGEMAKKRAQLVHWVAEQFTEYDLLLTPTVPYDPPPAKGPFPEETEGRQQPVASVAAFTIPFNLAWNPAATVRAGISKAGLPAGLQIVGAGHRDDLVLLAARAFERERPWHPNWPLR
jgi:aspartyl-tRNA(Asn)/glutamyl-tRNA(Gln) amidotransferase subunit A